MSAKTIDLCRPCYEHRPDKKALTAVKHSKDQKVICSGCGRRRFGATYAAGKQDAK
jgi:hypothetical protein